MDFSLAISGAIFLLNSGGVFYLQTLEAIGYGADNVCQILLSIH